VLRIALNGSLGRMGRMVIEAAGQDPEMRVEVLLDRPGHPGIGNRFPTPWGELEVRDDPRDIPDVDVAIDFSRPEGSLALARALAPRRIPLLIGTTGISPSEREELERLSADAPILVAGNTSLGVHVTRELARLARRLLGPEYDAEILEIHHRHKVDAPSGTALALAEAIGEGREVRRVSGRDGVCGPRSADEMGVMALRGGEVVGEHTVFFLGDHDRIEITHRAASRMVLARGALVLARRLAGRPPGMVEVGDLWELG
jgi:4-hydroxy-tetrahydrodipicolinate reductase